MLHSVYLVSAIINNDSNINSSSQIKTLSYDNYITLFLFTVQVHPSIFDPLLAEVFESGGFCVHPYNKFCLSADPIITSAASPTSLPVATATISTTVHVHLTSLNNDTATDTDTVSVAKYS